MREHGKISKLLMSRCPKKGDTNYPIADSYAQTDSQLMDITNSDGTLEALHDGRYRVHHNETKSLTCYQPRAMCSPRDAVKQIAPEEAHRPRTELLEEFIDWGGSHGRVRRLNRPQDCPRP